MVTSMTREEFDKKQMDIDENMIFERTHIIITSDKQVYLVGQQVVINLTKTNRDFVGTLMHTKKEWQEMLKDDVYKWMEDDKIYTSISFCGYGYTFEDKQTAYNFRDTILQYYLGMIPTKQNKNTQ